MKKLTLLFIACFLGLTFQAIAYRAPREQQLDRSEEDKVHLLVAQLAEQYEQFGVNYRRVIGPARFLHNNTIIVCDTALWNTATNVLDAWGNVEVIQENTRLLGESIHYMGDVNTGEVRGRVVELIDEDQNRLRTQNLNFNTKDSIGYFFNGGSMVDSEGTILESRRGYYYSKEKRFCFYEHVEMSTDTVRIKADSLYYLTDINLAEFWGEVQGWHTDGFLTAEEGTYDRENELFHFMHDVYIKTEDQEVWAQDLTYDRNNNKAVLLERIQIKDTTQSTLIFGDKLEYTQEPAWVEITQKPVFATYLIDEETNLPDTAFVAADTLRVYTATYGTSDSLDIAQSQARYINPYITDTTTAGKQSNAKKDELLPQADTAASQTDTLVPAVDSLQQPVPLPSVETPKRMTRKERKAARLKADSLALIQADSLKSLTPDSLALSSTDSLDTSVPDSLSANLPDESDPLFVTQSVADAFSDSLQTVIDKAFMQADSTFIARILFYGDSLYNSVEINYLYAYKNVKVYKSDMQMLCDSLVFNSIDSIGRLYGKPVLWNESSQFSADSIRLRMSRDSLFRADFLTNAFIISQEDSTFYHQIKGDEMIAHIRNNDVYQFDATGNVKALFYIPEDEIITSLNIVESTSMKALLENRTARRITYFQTVKSDMVPLFDLQSGQNRLKDFVWRQEDRPLDRYAVTDRVVVKDPPRPVDFYVEPVFPFTLKYFPQVLETFSTLREGVTTNALQELREREKENNTNPFIPDLRPPVSVNDSLQGMPIPKDTVRKTPPTDREILRKKQEEEAKKYMLE